MLLTKLHRPPLSLEHVYRSMMGVLVAFTYFFPNAELSLIFFPVPIKAKYFVPVGICRSNKE